MNKLFLKLKKNVSAHDITSYAAQCAYYLLLAFFPFIIIIIMVLTNMGYEYINSLIDSFARLPDQILELLQDYFTYSNKFSSLEFSPFIITIILMSSKAMGALMKAFNIVNDVTETRNFFYTKLISIIALIIVLFMIVVSIYISSMITNEVLQMAINSIILTISISSLYYILPNKKRKSSEIIPGAFLSTVLLIITVYTFGYFISNFTKYSAIYGSMSSVILLMILLYLFAFILMIGEELNALVKDE